MAIDKACSILELFSLVIMVSLLLSIANHSFAFPSFAKLSCLVMTSVSRIFLLALVLSKALANPVQQNEPSLLISDDISVGAIPNTLREPTASRDAIANPGNQYATSDSLDQFGSTGTSWSEAGSNGSPAAKSNDIWQQPVEKPHHSITLELTFQYKNEPGDSAGSVCKADTAARLFRRSTGTFRPCCFPIEIGLILVERHAFCCEGGYVENAPFRENCILCMLTVLSCFRNISTPTWVNVVLHHEEVWGLRNEKNGM